MGIFRAKDIFNKIDNSLIEDIIEVNFELLKKIRIIQLKMLKVLDELCRKNNIDIILGGGSFLGAVRHKGFIPWDDDIDLMMTRNNFEKLLKIIHYLPEEYEFQYSTVSNQSYCTFAKLMYKYSTLMEIGSENIPKLSGVYLDIFIIENVPDNKIISFFYGLRCNYMQFVSSSLVMFKFPSKYNKKIFMSSLTGKINFTIRNIIGLLYFFTDINKYLIKVDNIYKKYMNKNTKYMSIPTGRGHYFNELLPREIFTNLIDYQFENLKIKGIKSFETYLRNLYGFDYMQLPPLEKREKHYCIKINLEEKYQ